MILISLIANYLDISYSADRVCFDILLKRIIKIFYNKYFKKTYHSSLWYILGFSEKRFIKAFI